MTPESRARIEAAKGRYFVDTGDGVEFFETEDEARRCAEAALSDWRDLCDPEWPEEVEAVCWGQVREEIVRSTTTNAETGEEFWDYALVPLDADLTQQRALIEALGEALRNLVANARTIADPRMAGATDAAICALDDLDAARAALSLIPQAETRGEETK